MTWKVQPPAGEKRRYLGIGMLLILLWTGVWMPYSQRLMQAEPAPRDQVARAASDAWLLEHYRRVENINLAAASLFGLAVLLNILWFWRRNWAYWKGTVDPAEVGS